MDSKDNINDLNKANFEDEIVKKSDEFTDIKEQTSNDSFDETTIKTTNIETDDVSDVLKNEGIIDSQDDFSDEVYGTGSLENNQYHENSYLEPEINRQVYSQFQPLSTQKPLKKVNVSARVFFIMLMVFAQISVISLIVISVLSISDISNTSSSGNSYSGSSGDYSSEYDDSDDDSVDVDSYLPTMPDQPDIEAEAYTEGIELISSEGLEVLASEEVYEKVIQSTVTLLVAIEVNGVVTESSGTGIIVTSDGYILTNSHVVSDTKAVSVTVVTYDGMEYPAIVVGLDKGTDIAILKTDDYDFVPAEFGDSAELSMAETVMAIGSPSGIEFAGSVTSGIISGLDRYVDEDTQEIMTYIQTDTAINPGNSGGPLVNMYGQVIGINVSKIVGDSYEGMGFAIPITDAKEIIDQLLANGYVEGRVRLGITAATVDETTAAMYGIPQGVQIYTIDDDSCFIGTDVQISDIITAVNGYTITSLDDLSELLLFYNPGDDVEISIYRYDTDGGEEFTVNVTLIADEGETQG